MGRKGEGKAKGERGRGREGRRLGRKGGEREHTGIFFLSCFNFSHDALNIKAAKVPPGLSPLDSRCTPAQALFVKTWCLQDGDRRWTNSPRDCFASHGLCHQVPW